MMLAWYCSIPAVRITQCENEAVKTEATGMIMMNSKCQKAILLVPNIIQVNVFKGAPGRGQRHYLNSSRDEPLLQGKEEKRIK